jgi:PTS system nitrogen regulatory IIA component
LHDIRDMKRPKTAGHLTMSDSFLQSTLQPSLVRMRLAATEKTAAIRELLDILDGARLLPNRAEAERVVLARERMMSTGMENGLAIPHGKTDTVDRLLVALALKPEGMDFGCIDGQPARILICTLSPASRTGPHLRFMAEISRLLQDPGARDRLLSARTPHDVLAALT